MEGNEQGDGGELKNEAEKTDVPKKDCVSWRLNRQLGVR